MSLKTCIEEDCGRPALRRGMCTTHYTRWHKAKTVAEGIYSTCSVDGCGKTYPGGAKLCKMHEARKRRHGDVSTTLNPNFGRYKENREIYFLWWAMVNRCTNPNHPHFKRYGGKGIGIAPQWRDFETFVADILASIGPRPAGREVRRKDSYSLDRIDNSKGYEPGNVRWATWKEQAQNRSNTKLSDADVRRIRELIGNGNSKRSVAGMFHVSTWTVHDVVGGRRR